MNNLGVPAPSGSDGSGWVSLVVWFVVICVVCFGVWTLGRPR